MKTLPNSLLRQLASYDSCTVSNAIEQFDVRTRNEGFMNGSVRCIYPGQAPVIGYAVTATMKSSSTPVTGGSYYDRPDWWSYVQSMPAPRFIVVQDIDSMPGFGALFGEVHARIAIALSCVAYATNGAVRDLPGARSSGLQMFAGGVSVSHAYAHIVHFGGTIEVGGLSVNPGDLLHGDEHGIVSIPLEICEQIPETAGNLLAAEKQLFDYCASAAFSPEGLQQEIARTATNCAGRGREPIA